MMTLKKKFKLFSGACILEVKAFLKKLNLNVILFNF